MVGSQDCKGEEINWPSVNNDKGTAHAKAKALVWAVLPREASFLRITEKVKRNLQIYSLHFKQNIENNIPHKKTML